MITQFLPQTHALNPICCAHWGQVGLALSEAESTLQKSPQTFYLRHSYTNLFQTLKTQFFVQRSRLFDGGGMIVFEDNTALLARWNGPVWAGKTTWEVLGWGFRPQIDQVSDALLEDILTLEWPSVRNKLGVGEITPGWGYFHDKSQDKDVKATALALDIFYTQSPFKDESLKILGQTLWGKSPSSNAQDWVKDKVQTILEDPILGTQGVVAQYNKKKMTNTMLDSVVAPALHFLWHYGEEMARSSAHQIMQTHARLREIGVL